MFIQLTTPIPVVPALDPVVTEYTQVRILSFHFHENYLEFRWAYGNTIDGKWCIGQIPIVTTVLEGDDLTAAKLALPYNLETIFQAGNRYLYEYLMTINPNCVGIIT